LGSSIFVRREPRFFGDPNSKCNFVFNVSNNEAAHGSLATQQVDVGFHLLGHFSGVPHSLFFGVRFCTRLDLTGVSPCMLHMVSIGSFNGKPKAAVLFCLARTRGLKTQPPSACR